MNRLRLYGLLLAAQLSAIWALLLWYGQRLTDKSDEPYGVLALITLAALTAMQARQATKDTAKSPLPAKALLVAGSLTIAYALCNTFCPMLFSACFGVMALAALVSFSFQQRIFHLPTWGLALLSLPMVASLQFYAGFPLRVICMQAAAKLLAFSGYLVQTQGTGLIWNTHLIGIDSACSGIKLLWAAIYLGLTLSFIKQLTDKGTIYLLLIAFITAIVGNVFRASSLFFLEILPLQAQGGNGAVASIHSVPIFMAQAMQASMPPWSHDAVGVTIFACMAAAISFAGNLLARRHTASDTSPALLRALLTGGSALAPALFIAVCGATALLSLLPLFRPELRPNFRLHKDALSQKFVAPLSFEGRILKPIALNAQEVQLQKLFPGQIRKFSDGPRQIIYRRITTPTRQLHPAQDCFKGGGYTIHPLPNFMDRKKNLWGQFRASKDGQVLVVRECIFDEANNSWPDVSSWYWAALLGKSAGPWTAMTVAGLSTAGADSHME